MKVFLGKYLIVVIILLSFALRFYNLSGFPGSLSIDEVSFGWNGYLVLTTGMDEYGKHYPLVFQALGDWKLPVPIYLTSFSIAAFGLSEFAIRFPAAFTGALSPLLVYLVMIKLSYSKKAASLGALTMALAPWHLVYSRASFETITALFFVLLGLYFYFSGRVSIAGLFFGVSLWTYNSMRVFVPLLVVFLIFYSKNRNATIKKNWPFILSLGTLILLSILSPEVVGRASDLWIGNDPATHDLVTSRGYLGFYSLLQAWVKQYLQYFDLRFLFWKGMNLTPMDHLGVGTLLVVDLPLVIYGLTCLARDKKRFRRSLVIFWLLLGPLAASVTRGEPSSVRTVLWLPTFIFLMGYAFEWMIKRRAVVAIYLAGLAIAFAYSWNLYTVAFTKYSADIWHYGYKDAMIYICAHQDQYDQIIVTDKYGRIAPNVKTVPNLYYFIYCDHPSDKVSFREPQWFYDAPLKNALLVGSNWNFPENFPDEWVNETFYFPSGEVALKVVATSDEKANVLVQ